MEEQQKNSGISLLTDYIKSNTRGDTSLQEPDLDKLRHDRLERNYTAMMAADSNIAERMFPRSSTVFKSNEEKSAIIIQKNYRGYQDRKKYVQLLYEKFEKEEKKLQRKIEEQLEEGELLLENHRLEVLLNDNMTTRKNKTRHYVTDVITIQRAWRAYIRKRDNSGAGNGQTVEDATEKDTGTEKEMKPSIIDQNQSAHMDASGSPPQNQILIDQSNRSKLCDERTCYSQSSDSTPEENTQKHTHDSTPEDDRVYRLPGKLKHSRDADCESLSSDYSEVSGPLRDVAESELYVVQEQSLSDKISVNSFPGNQDLLQNQETEEELSKRLRKVNLLSIAQEFAELKKINSDALPFDLHKRHDSTQSESCSFCSEGSSQPSSVMTSPSDSFQTLEQLELKKNCDLEKGENPHSKTSEDPPESQKQTQNDKVAMNGKESLVPDKEGDFEVYNIETTMPTLDWESLEQQLQQATQKQRKVAQKNDREEIRKKLAMGIGMDNEFPDSDKLYKKSNLPSRQSGTNLQICFMNEEEIEPKQQKPQCPLDKKPEHRSPKKENNQRNHKERPKDEDFFKTQAHLQQEAKLALAQASTMAHMQLEVEKQKTKRSPVTDIVGLPSLEDVRKHKVEKHVMYEMNLGQLQTLVNQLHTQIENLNEELMKSLMERDELHMSQDSMLVDIEDLTRRAEQTASRMQAKAKSKKS